MHTRRTGSFLLFSSFSCYSSNLYRFLNISFLKVDDKSGKFDKPLNDDSFSKCDHSRNEKTGLVTRNRLLRFRVASQEATSET